MKYSDLVRAHHRQMLHQMEMIARGEDPRAIIPLGLREFDKRAGLKRRQLTLFGAQTGEGKSLWVKHMMESAARAGFQVLVFSFEDPKERTAERTLATLTGINSTKLMTLDLSPKELIQITMAAEEVGDWGDNITFYEGLKATSEVLSAIESSTADLVIVDYLQALSEEDGDNLERTLAKFCWRLNKWAQDTGGAAVALSQVNNKPEERGIRWMERARYKDADGPPNVEGFRPIGPSDLNWCSAAGHRAKDVGYLFRPGRYLKRFGHPAKDDVMEISYPKSNFGSEGLLRVGFDAKCARFYDLAKES